MVYVKDLMELDYFRKVNLKLVAGERGLNRIVSRPNIAQLMSFTDWMVGGEFLLINGVGLHMNQIENMLLFIEKANSKNVACIAFLVGNEYIKEIPKEAIDLANNLKLPIFQLPWETVFGEALNAIYDFIVRKQMEDTALLQLMENIMFRDVKEELSIHQGEFYGYDLKKAHRVVIFEINNYVKYVNEKEVEYREILKELENHICYELSIVLKNNKLKILSIVNNDCVVILLPEVVERFMSIEEIISNLYKRLLIKNGNLELFIGVGRIYERIGDFKKSFYEGEKALKAAKMKKENIIYFEKMGIYRLLVDCSNYDLIRKYVIENIGELIEYDEKNSSQLTITLEKFILHNYNLAKTAEAMFIHRNTVIMRVSKIEEILKIDLDDSYIRRELSNAIYLWNFVK